MLLKFEKAQLWYLKVGKSNNNSSNNKNASGSNYFYLCHYSTWIRIFMDNFLLPFRRF